jgi:hypothetical protein
MMKGIGYITVENFAEKHGIDAAVVEEDLRAGDREGFRRQGVWFIADEIGVPAQEPVGKGAAPRAAAHAPVKPHKPLSLSSRYSMTRAMSRIISLVGWIGALAGVAGVGHALMQAGGHVSVDEATVMTLLPYLVALAAGPLLIMGGQMIRATVDTADQTRHIVMLLQQRT